MTPSKTDSNESSPDQVLSEKPGVSDEVDRHGPPPLQLDQEWANALTHGIGTVGAFVAGIYLVMLAIPEGTGLAIACAAYVAGAVGTFFFSTMSHIVRRQPLLNNMRAWDQAMIYAMISGTYTPIAYRFATEEHRIPLLAALWIAAGTGFVFKVVIRHRINSIGPFSYLLLGWLPAIPLAGHVPSSLVWTMVIGGVLYSIGVLFLMNDSKIRYMHAAWHVSVITAAAVHYFGILYFVVNPS